MNKQNAKHIKISKQRINAHSMASYKMVGLLLARRWENKNRFLLIKLGSGKDAFNARRWCMIWGYWDILGQKIMYENLA